MIKFQESKAFTSHFDSFLSIVDWKPVYLSQIVGELKSTTVSQRTFAQTKRGTQSVSLFFSRQSFLETIGLFLLFFRRTTSRKWSETNKKSFGAVREKSVQTYIWDSSYLLPYYLQFLPLFEMTKDLMFAQVWKIHNTGANSLNITR